MKDALDKLDITVKEKNQIDLNIVIMQENFDRDFTEQEDKYKEKISELEKVFETLLSKIDELKSERNVKQLSTDRVKVLEIEVERLEAEKSEVLRDKDVLSEDFVKCRKELLKIKSENANLALNLKSEKEKVVSSNGVLI